MAYPSHRISLATVALGFCLFALLWASSAAEPFRKQNLVTAREDQIIRHRIKDALFWSMLVDDDHVRVTVRDRKAYLSGTVEGWDSFGAAIEKAFEGGARQVRVRLNVPGYTYQGLGGGHYFARKVGQPERSSRRSPNDRALQRRIEQHLFLSPFVNQGRVKVRVRNGIAVLTGSVDDWSSHGGATENAFEGGAVAVRNLLQVKPDRPD